MQLTQQIVGENRKVLVIDDDPLLLDRYQQILSPQKRLKREMDELSELVGDPQEAVTHTSGFELTLASQGEEGIALAQEAFDQHSPYAVAFIDMRMPPGIDGLETANRLRKVDPDIYLVIVSAYSDHSLEELRSQIDQRLLYISKPFNQQEVEQIAHNHCFSYHRDQILKQQLEHTVAYESYLQRILHTLPVPVYVIDVESYQIRFSSDSNFDPAKECTTRCFEVSHHATEPCSSQGLGCPIEQMVKSGKPSTVEHIHFDANGNERCYEVHAIPLHDQQGEIVQAVEFALDITDRREQLQRQEAQLRQQQNLFEIHKSTSHTIKNSLNYLNAMIGRLQDQNSHNVDLNEVLNADNLSMLSDQLRNIQTLSELSLKESKVSSLEKQSLHIIGTVHEALQLFAVTKLGKSREVIVETDPAFGSAIDDPMVSISPLNLQTVLINLLNNAAESVDEYFSILIGQTSTMEEFEKISALHDKPTIRLEIKKLDEAVSISVINLGTPIAKDITQKIFEPGFTTKQAGNGIGLHDVRTIITESSGTIHCNCSEDEVQFTFTLPITTDCQGADYGSQH